MSDQIEMKHREESLAECEKDNLQKSDDHKIPRIKPKVEHFEFSKLDRLLTWLMFVLGFLFIKWVFFAWQGYGVAVFTTLYCIVVIGYLKKKAAFTQKEGIFWFAIVWLIGLSYALTVSSSVEPWRSMFLVSMAAYAVMVSTHNTLLGRTDRYWPIDLLNIGVIIPIKNIDLQAKSISQIVRDKHGNSHSFFQILIGIIVFIAIAMVLMPLLLSADGGGFKQITKGFDQLIQVLKVNFSFNVMNAILAVPVAMYLYGLVVGSASKRYTKTMKSEQIKKSLETVKVISDITIVTVFGLICFIYCLFIITQIPYFFSAFIGKIPEGFKSYSQYARSGFFELCQIAIINILLILLANLLQKGEQRLQKVMKILKSILSALTIILIITALSKMFIYMNAYGLTVKRLMPCFFMLFLAFIFGGIMIQQIRPYAIHRVVIITGSVAICALSLVNLNDIVCEYNVTRYLEGTLYDFDVEVLYRAKESGVNASIRLYEATDDENLKGYLISYLWKQKKKLYSTHGGIMTDTLKGCIAGCFHPLRGSKGTRAAG